MDATDLLGKAVKVEIDRPLGSRHPQHGFIYPVNYGYVPGVIAPDGKELDAYILGVFEPLNQYEGRCIAVIRRMDDDDDKLVIVPPGKMCTDDQIRALTEFQERFFTSVIVREKTVTLPAFQRNVADFVEANELEIPVQARLLDLVSEVGELAKEVLEASGYGRQQFQPTSEWAGELGDVLFSLGCVANSTGVNLEVALERAMDKYRQRLALKGDVGSGKSPFLSRLSG